VVANLAQNFKKTGRELACTSVLQDASAKKRLAGSRHFQPSPARISCALDYCSPVVISEQRLASVWLIASQTDQPQWLAKTAERITIAQLPQTNGGRSQSRVAGAQAMDPRIHEATTGYEVLVQRARRGGRETSLQLDRVRHAAAALSRRALTPSTRAGDTLAAMLKLLKRDKVLAYKQMFLMYPMHKDEEVTLINPDYVVE
jgi:hypothetical protein